MLFGVERFEKTKKSTLAQKIKNILLLKVII